MLELYHAALGIALIFDVDDTLKMATIAGKGLTGCK
jgi:hypothetical protein